MNAPLVTFYLHYTEDTEYQWSGWQFTRDESDIFGFVSNEADDNCPTGPKNSPWRYQLNGVWHNDDTVTVSCEGIYAFYAYFQQSLGSYLSTNHTF